MTSTLQTLTTIPIIGDIKGVAILNGNNVALACPCGYRLPLIWSGNTPKQKVKCPECKKEFKGGGQIPPNSRKPPQHITGKESPETNLRKWSTIIPVESIGKLKYVAVKRGSGLGANAAWMCVCGYRLPLLWRNLSKSCPVQCAGCNRLYKGTNGSGKDIEKIEEVTPSNRL